MNPFTTDHPLAAQTSWSDAREYQVRSVIFRTVALAVILTPLVLQRLYDYAVSDIGAEPNPFPQPWWALFWGCLIAFVLSVVGAFPVVVASRLISRRWRKWYAA